MSIQTDAKTRASIRGQAERIIDLVDELDAMDPVTRRESPAAVSAVTQLEWQVKALVHAAGVAHSV